MNEIMDGYGMNDQFGCYVNWGRCAMNRAEEILIYMGEGNYLTLTEFRESRDALKDDEEAEKWITYAPRNNVFIITKF